jgi:hypothetical protein
LQFCCSSADATSINAVTAGNPSLFERLRQLRETVEAACDELETLRGSMNRQSEPDPQTRWEHAEDLHAQLGHALHALDVAFDYMAPTKHHVDQPADTAVANRVHS